MDQADSVKNVVFTILQAIAAVVLAYFAIQTTRTGLTELRELRQLERIPQIDVIGAIPGEAILSGQVSLQEQLTSIISPKGKAPSVYYRYRVEKRCKDSDGNESWCTQSDTKKHVPFNLLDNTGSILLVPTNGIDWQAPERYQSVSGGYRYTEWRIEPNDRIHAFGFIQQQQLRFAMSGDYLPIITMNPISEARGDVGHEGLVQLWAGVSLGMFSLYFVMLVVRVHRVLLHVSVLTVALVVFLSTDGLAMIRADLLNANHWINEREKLSINEINKVLAKHDYAWSSWHAVARLPDSYPSLYLAEQQRIEAIYQGLLQSKLGVSEHANRLFGRIALLGSDYQLPEIPVFDWARINRQQSNVKSEIKGWFPWVEFIAGWLLALIVGYYSIKAIRWKRFIENLPTTKIKGIMPGVAEIQGNVEICDGDKPLISPLKQRECVYYHYVEKEKRGSGKNSKWVTVVDDKTYLDCKVKDETATIRIDLEEAELISRHNYSKTRGRRSYKETIISVHDKLFVIGDCQFQPAHAEELILTNADNATPFIVSNYPESVVMLKKARLGMGLLTASFSLFMLVLLVGFGMAGDFAFSDIVFAGLTAPVFGFIIVAILHYNDLIYLKQRISRNWSNIEVLLQKRFDLFNSLQPVVQKMFDHEQELLTLLRGLRSESSPSVGDTQSLKSTMQQQASVENKLIALKEDYPELNANEVVRRFMATLSDMETEISLVRAAYNDSVETYNSRIQSFPDFLLAKVFKFSAQEFGRW
ncbi:MAG: LemA family protein [Pseudomonadales bacterium]|nr:LemA family protein [Pseudomonadales bacterium]